MKNFKKILSLALAGVMIIGNITPVFAELTNTVEVTKSELPNSNLTEVIYNQKSTFSITVPKTVVLDAQKKSDYTVTVTGDISSDEEINIIPDESFKMSDTSTVNTKDDVTATVSQDKTKWYFNEFETIGNGEITASELTAGNWEGSFFFNIKLDSNYISVAAKNEAGEDLNATATQITGERKEQLLTSLEETGYIASSDEVDALINVKSDDFEGLAETTFDVSNIAEEGEQVVILHFDETKQEWEYIGTDTVNTEGTITVDFTSYSPIAFVKVTEDGTLESIEDVAGLYDTNGVLLCTWENSGIDVEKNYTDSTSDSNFYKNSTTSGYYVLTNIYPKATKIILPEGIKEIGYYAFSDCNNLTDIIISDSVINIKIASFEGCTRLSNITIPDNVINIMGSAFSGCTELTNVIIGNSVNSISTFAFYNCTNLTNVTFTNLYKWYVGKNSGGSLTYVSVSTPSQNARYLTSTYYNYYWIRK